MLGIFKRKEVAQETERQQEVLQKEDVFLPDTIDVNNLKQYVVDGYTKEKDLLEQIEKLKEKIVYWEEYKKEQDVKSVILSEYEMKNKRLEKQIEDCDKVKSMLRSKIENAESEINTYKITIENRKQQEKEFAQQSVDQYKNKMIEKIKSTKGNLSKQKVIDILSDKKELLK